MRTTVIKHPTIEAMEKGSLRLRWNQSTQQGAG